jgi:2Fe-2S ferredoxin
MPKITYIADTGETTQVEAAAGDSVMETAIQNGVAGIVAECGGNCQCATCHVYVDQAWLARLPPPAEDEDVMLGSTAAERQPNSRLSCQIRVTAALDGLVVRTPPRQV